MTFLDAIKKLQPGGIARDAGERASVTGLHVRCLPTGKKSFLVHYRTKAGIQRRPKIGEFPEITVGEARRRAGLILAQVAVGEDPKGDWDGQKQELTVAELFAQTKKEYWDPSTKISEGWKGQVLRNWNLHLEPAFGRYRASELQPEHVEAWLSRYEEKPYVANRSLSILSKVYNFAQKRRWVDPGVNPCLLVDALPERKRKRYARPEEISKIGELLDREAFYRPAAVALVYALAYTGARPTELTNATWDMLEEVVVNVDGAAEVFGKLVFHGKTTNETGELLELILPPQVMDLVYRIPRTAGGKIFGYAGCPYKLWYKVRKEAGCPDLWIRDWRRTFATVGMSQGVGIGQISEILNHKSAQTTKVYALLADDSKMKAVSAIAGSLEKMLKAGKGVSK